MRNIGAKVRVVRLAGRQWDLVTVVQLVALEIDRATISRWVADGFLRQVHPRVYAVGQRARGFEAELAAALLYAGPGAMLSHATAIWWLGLSDRQPRAIDVSTPRRCQSLRGIRVHGRRACQRIWHKGLPSTTIEQALLDYATTAPLERLFLPLCERIGIPLPEVNVYVAGVLVDAVWRDKKLVVELDGRNNHSSWAQIQDDRSKELRVRAAGFGVVRYGTRQLEEEATLVEADLRRAHGVPA